MAVTTLRPNGDGSTLEWTPSSGTTHYTLVDDVSSQPGGTDVDGGNVAKSGAAGTSIDEFLMESTTITTSATQIKVWVRGVNAGSATASVYTNIFVDGAWQTQTILGFTGSESWQSATYTGTWDQTDIDDLQVRLVWTAGSMTISPAQMKVVYVEVTHDVGAGPPPSLFVGLLV